MLHSECVGFNAQANVTEHIHSCSNSIIGIRLPFTWLQARTGKQAQARERGFVLYFISPDSRTPSRVCCHACVCIGTCFSLYHRSAYHNSNVFDSFV